MNERAVLQNVPLLRSPGESVAHPTAPTRPEPAKGITTHDERPPEAGALRGGLRAPLVSRRRLQLALALLWLLDGALQLQPFMFTRGFAEQVIAPSAQAQPAFIAAAVHWSESLILGHPIMWDALFAATQLAIGIALLFRRTTRSAIAASVVWSLGVWTFGEGMGGLAGGTASFLTGAPGAVALYALIGLAAWPRLRTEDRVVPVSRSAALQMRLRVIFAPAGDERPAAWVPRAWAVMWVLFALLQAVPVGDLAGALSSQFRANVSSAPGWLAYADHVLGAAAAHGGPGPVIGLIAVEFAVGLFALRRGTPRRVAAGIGIGMALAAWVLGQAFGQIPAGIGTDPSSGPLVALLGVAMFGSHRGRVRHARRSMTSSACGRRILDRHFGR